MSSEEEIDSPLGEEPLAATANGRVSGEDEDQIDQEELADLFGEGENGEGDPGSVTAVSIAGPSQSWVS